jgi:DUF1365 family protein
MELKTFIGFGQVRHKRYRPRVNLFTYRTFFLMLQMRGSQKNTDHPHSENSLLVWNRWGGLAFYDKDHGDGRGPQAGGALSWLEEFLRQAGIQDADGEIWLHTYPRVWGYAFKPVSFWYCHKADGSLRTVVAEVNNTFGERHFYLINHPTFAKDVRACKEFHVSPFCKVLGYYTFRFFTKFDSSTDPSHTVVRIDYSDHEGLLIHTSVSGQLEPLTPQTKFKALIGYPLLTLMIIFRIHWQALKLVFLKIPFNKKPALPADPITLSSNLPFHSDAKS